MTLTGYPAPEIRLPVTDSLVFTGSGSDYYIPRLAICNTHVEVVPHNYVIDDIKETKKQVNYNVFPNPFKSNFNILNPGNEKLYVTLLNPVGTTVYCNTALQKQLTVEPLNFSEGVYFLKINTKNHIFIKKLIKVK